MSTTETETSRLVANVQEQQVQQREQQQQREEQLDAEQSESNAHIAAFAACVPVFAGYACFVSLQERIRRFMGIDGNSPDASTFDIAISTFFYVILCVRLLHNILFSFLR